jgi:predicted NAD-dependent protein-ADP-ribosyltransferase YbiA (DUF1768 family)
VTSSQRPLGQRKNDNTDKRSGATRIAKTANIHKFTSDDTESRDLLRQLKVLGNRELVFADPSDAILGIGFSASEAKEVDRAEWGANVFGKSLDAVRTLVKTTDKTMSAKKKQKHTQASSGRGDLDTPIFDVGGRMSVNW